MSTFRYIFLLFLAGLLTGCIDDNIFDADPSACESENPEAGGALGFYIGTTRGGFNDPHNPALSQSDEEIVVNPDNFHVVIFTAGGSVLEEWANQELTEIYDSDATFGTRKKYYVKIPADKMSDEVIKYIRNNPFKIAVFANWAEYPPFETSSGKKEANGIDRNNIFYITHCKYDTSYESTTDNENNQEDDSKTLYFITGDGYMMGMNQEWVVDRYSSDEETDSYIRANYDVENRFFHSTKKPVITNAAEQKVTFSDMKDVDYHNVWEVWNFGGSQNLNKENFYYSPNAKISSDWAAVNNDWYNDLYPNGVSRWIPDEPSYRGLTIVGNQSDDYNYIPYAINVNGGGIPGICLRATARSTSGNSSFNPSGGNYIYYQLPAHGYIYVKCRANAGTAQLVVRRGAFGSGDHVKMSSRTVGTDFTTCEFSWKSSDNEIIRATGEPQDLVIYAVGGDISIYEIDYIKSYMVQSTDRQMINPANTPEGGISMYGIQDFERVPETIWPKGTTFNLSRQLSTSTANSYRYRTISLLRSVAKVEVFLPTNIFPEPSHMFLRTLNRFSRSAPIDVFTPTDILWDGYYKGEYSNKGYLGTVKDDWSTPGTRSVGNGRDHYYYNALGVDEEINAIQIKGFTYEKGNEVKSDYQNRLAWLFGVWNSQFGWDWAGEPIWITKEGPYPRIFNTRINRTDYAHMIDGGKVNLAADGTISEGNDYYYYYAYLPEKNVTDPNNNGTLNSDPKVVRIEMRFADRNTDTNLDDNAAYRIYFTPGGAGGTDNRDAYDNTWESGKNNVDNVQQIYPVMRNHLYRFKVTGLQMNELQVDFEVKGPDRRNIVYEFE